MFHWRSTFCSEAEEFCTDQQQRVNKKHGNQVNTMKSMVSLTSYTVQMFFNQFNVYNSEPNLWERFEIDAVSLTSKNMEQATNNGVKCIHNYYYFFYH